MLNRRTPFRAALVLVAAVLTAAGLSGCRADPSVAAYVGNGQISVRDLNAAVAERTASDPALAAAAKKDPAGYTQQVLNVLIQERVYAAAADRYGVVVTNGDVDRRIATLAGGDPDTFFQQLASGQHLGRSDVESITRDQLVLLGIAVQKGTGGPVSTSALNAAYEKAKVSQAQVQFGYITVPDQATADAVLAQLGAGPASYPAVAAQHPGDYTLPDLETRTPDQIPSQLRQGVAAAQPNTAFSTSVPEVGGIVVTFVGTTTYPSFEQLRPQLQQAAEQQVFTATQKYIEPVRADLHVTVNPRYGVLTNGAVTTPSTGVVQVLGSGSGSGAAATGTAGG